MAGYQGTIKILGHQTAAALFDAEINEQINDIFACHELPFDRELWPVLSDIYNLGVINGKRQERKNKKSLA